MNDPAEGHRWAAPAADQFEFVFTPAPQPPKFRQTEFPWRYRRDRRRPNYEAFKRLRGLLGRGTRQMKELVSIRPLLRKAKDELRALTASEIRLRENHDEILRRAWTLGGYLCELKENIRRGSWLIWLPQICPNSGARIRHALRTHRGVCDSSRTTRLKSGIPDL